MPKTGKSKRIKQLIIRVSFDEFEQLNNKKNSATLAKWMRETLLEQEKSKNIKRNSDLPPEIARILAGMGNNLNQIAKQLNSAAKAGILGNVEAVRAITEIAAAERSLNALRDFLANKREAEK